MQKLMKSSQEFLFIIAGFRDFINFRNSSSDIRAPLNKLVYTQNLNNNTSCLAVFSVTVKVRN